ncbi:hypothetical protein GC425_04425 [Corynebacterium sp. zg254]|uniref:Secreted protein n=1 Tax=Corynebacterium zhongnanshanii TaxID=2768834 RepID=A0ABQ6VI47_9CORY|nr:MULTISPECIES: hypothetical protein [Corynebacterium]KAB3522816.1 hypothetical protein F8377_01195 [Corynebacterium zhongnanshanii]MCR5914117.1 hypothetical protein [Corynebacterium sp. zg254]
MTENQYPPQQQPANWQYQGPYQQGQPTPQNQPSPKDQRIVTILAVIAAVLAVALLAVGGLLLFTGQDEESLQAGTFAEKADGASSSDASEESKEKDKGRPTKAELPAGVVAVNDAARNNEPVGNLNSVWKSGPTSPSFAQAVRNEYVNKWSEKKDNYNLTIDVYSPVTYTTYTMNCQDKGSYVHCTGGINANVYIA